MGVRIVLRQSLLAAALVMASLAGAGAQTPGKYPDWAGAWERIGGGSFDPNRRPGRAQQPPLNAEYRAIWEANMAEEKAGGQSYNTQVHCLPGGMPRMMTAYQPVEIAENNLYVFLGKESYFLSADRELMPTRTDQPPPDLRNFRQ